MRIEDLHVGLPVRIMEGHPSGYGGRIGNVVNVGEFESADGSIRINGAEIDIQEPLLVLVDARYLIQVDQGELPPGWEEFNL